MPLKFSYMKSPLTI